MSKQIMLEAAASAQRQAEPGIALWPVWEKKVSWEISCFPWFYDSPETCFLIEGALVVAPAGGTCDRQGRGHHHVSGRHAVRMEHSQTPAQTLPLRLRWQVEVVCSDTVLVIRHTVLSPD